MTEQEKKPKLLFGLSPKSTIINIFILIFLASIMWSVKYLQQFPPGVILNNLPADFKAIDNVPWYYDMPIVILALFMGREWIGYFFNIEKGDRSWRAFKYTYIYLIGTILLIEVITKSIILAIYFFIH